MSTEGTIVNYFLVHSVSFLSAMYICIISVLLLCKYHHRLLLHIFDMFDKANLGDLIAATGLVILLNIGFKSFDFYAHVTLKFDG